MGLIFFRQLLDILFLFAFDENFDLTFHLLYLGLKEGILLLLLLLALQKLLLASSQLLLQPLHLLLLLRRTLLCLARTRLLLLQCLGQGGILSLQLPELLLTLRRCLLEGLLHLV